MGSLRASALALSSLCACSTQGASAPDAGSFADAAHEQRVDATVPDASLDAGPPCVIPDQGLPDDVFCTGLYEGRSSAAHATDALPYAPGLKFWSDGAQKDRYLYLPPAAQIDTSNWDSWVFPVGTKAWKEFRIGGKLIETRIFWKRAVHDWQSGTYIWNDSESEAALNTSLKPTLLSDGYEIPTARDCGKCHHGGSDSLLGLEAVALSLPDAQGATLSMLASAGKLSHPQAITSKTLPEDSTGKAAAALGYLHVNCGMPCHSTRGLGDETLLVLRIRADELWPALDGGVADLDGGVAVAQTDTYRATIDRAPTTLSVEQKYPGAHRIVPGSHEQSLVWQLAHVRGNYQMPPLVSHRVDDAGTQSLADWIDALPAQ